MSQENILDYLRQTPHNTNVNVVKGMINNVGNSELPEVTLEDNGKVLTVIDGQWNKANVPSGSIDTIIPTVIMSVDNTKHFVVMTEEDANKIFDNYPIAFKLKQFIDGEFNASQLGCFLNVFGEDNGVIVAEYSASYSGVSVFLKFSKEVSIDFVMAQESTILIQYHLIWDSNLECYVTNQQI